MFIFIKYLYIIHINTKQAIEDIDLYLFFYIININYLINIINMKSRNIAKSKNKILYNQYIKKTNYWWIRWKQKTNWKCSKLF